MPPAFLWLLWLQGGYWGTRRQTSATTSSPPAVPSAKKWQQLCSRSWRHSAAHLPSCRGALPVAGDETEMQGYMLTIAVILLH